MANVYWHGDGGNWSDFTNHWFNATDGGGGSHGAAPGADDNAIFDLNSFDNPAQTVTIDANSTCLNMTWTGATNTPTLATATNRLDYYGDVTLITAMSVTGTTGRFNAASNGAQSFTSNGCPLGCKFMSATADPTVTLADDLVVTNTAADSIFFVVGTLVTGGNTITDSGQIDVSGGTITPSSSTINCTAWLAIATTTITANTATINVTGTGAVALGTANWNGADFNLNGTAHTVTGTGTGIVHFTRTGTAAACTVTFNSDLVVDGTLTLNGNAVGNRLTVGGTANILTCLSFAGNHVDFSTPLTLILTNAGAGATTFAGNGQTYPHVRQEGAGAYALTISGNNTFAKFRNDSSAAVKTTTITPASTQTIRNLQVFSSAANVAVFNTGGAAATIQKHRGYCELNHVNLTSIVATEKYRYYAGNNSTDGTGNTNWIFTHKARGVE